MLRSVHYLGIGMYSHLKMGCRLIGVLLTDLVIILPASGSILLLSDRSGISRLTFLDFSSSGVECTFFGMITRECCEGCINDGWTAHVVLIKGG